MNRYRPRSLTAVFLLLGVSATATAQEPTWQSLFDGESLAGWVANESPATWVVEDGAIVTKGPRSHLFYQGEVGEHEFTNFEFSAEVMTTPGSNSGIYMHTRLAPDPWPASGYECQIINSTAPAPGKYRERKMTGSIYAVRNTWVSPARDNEWFEYRIKVSGKTIQTFINGQLICQYTEAPAHWRAADKSGRRLSRGTIALQGHDPLSEVRYRNLRIRLLPDDTPSLESALANAGLDESISRLSDRNFPLIDIGLKANSVSQELAQLESARRYGVTLGYTLGENVTLETLGTGGTVVVINDRESPPSIEQLQAAQAAGFKIVFSSGGATRLDPGRLQARFAALLESGIAWDDLWVPEPAQ